MEKIKKVLTILDGVLKFLWDQLFFISAVLLLIEAFVQTNETYAFYYVLGAAINCIWYSLDKINKRLIYIEKSLNLFDDTQDGIVKVLESMTALLTLKKNLEVKDGQDI